MKIATRNLLLLSLVILCCYRPCVSQDSAKLAGFRDSNYINVFKKNNVAEIYTGSYRTRFDFTTPGNNQRDLSLVANGSAYLGGFISYKWASLKYAVFLPGTEQARGQKLSYTSFKFRFSTRHMLFHPFYNSYNGLLVPQQTGRRNFNVVRNVSIRDAGIDYYYFTNSARYSFKSAMFFSEQQRRSAGGLFFMITPKWQQATWLIDNSNNLHDTTTMNLFSRKPSWVSVTGRIGYGYNFSFDKGRFLVAPSVLAGVGGLRELRRAAHWLEPVTDLQATLNAGYNGHSWYLYAASWMNIQKSNLQVKDMQQTNTEFSLTFGYRFPDMRKKLLSIL